MGTFDGDELLAKVNGREYHSWFGGAEIPTWGIAGVAVSAEHRGRRLLRDLFTATFAEARARGMAVSTLYFTAAGIYRSIGYELVGGFDKVRAAHRDAGRRTRRRTGIRLRRAVSRGRRGGAGGLHRVGVPAERATHPHRPELHRTARTGSPSTTPASRWPLDADDRVVGYVSWQPRERVRRLRPHRGRRPASATTPDATRALLRMLGTFASVTGCRGAADLSQARSGGSGAPRHCRRSRSESRPYMLRVLDLPVRRRAPPLPAGAGHRRSGFTVTGDTFGDLDGGWRISVANGAARCERAAGRRLARR